MFCETLKPHEFVSGEWGHQVELMISNPQTVDRVGGLWLRGRKPAKSPGNVDEERKKKKKKGRKETLELAGSRFGLEEHKGGERELLHVIISIYLYRQPLNHSILWLSPFKSIELRCLINTSKSLTNI